MVALGGHQDLDDTCHMPVVSRKDPGDAAAPRLESTLKSQIMESFRAALRFIRHRRPLDLLRGWCKRCECL